MRAAYVPPNIPTPTEEEARVADLFRLGQGAQTFEDSLRCRTCGHHHHGGAPQDDFHMLTPYKVAAGLPVWKHGFTSAHRPITTEGLRAWLQASGTV